MSGCHQGPRRQRPPLRKRRGRRGLRWGRLGQKIRGNNGDDRLLADDGRYDEVWCGSGTDYVYADVRDTVYYGRETVKR